jgi:hypothetical protein
MDSRFAYLIAADAILFTHVLFVVFVIFGLLLIVAGKVYLWSWVRNPWFRLVHLLGIAIVVLQSWVGAICPLTNLEMAFRSKSGDAVYVDSFVSYWLGNILYYRAPAWVFVFCYTVFGLVVLASWFWVRPRPFSKPKCPDAT